MFLSESPVILISLGSIFCVDNFTRSKTRQETTYFEIDTQMTKHSMQCNRTSNYLLEGPKKRLAPFYPDSIPIV